MLNFAWPWMILLLPLPAMLFYFKAKAQKKKLEVPAVLAFPKLHNLKNAFLNSNSKPGIKISWQLVLCIVAWVCLVICMMRPEWIRDTAYARNAGYDLMLAVDLSLSMEAVDFIDSGRPISRIAATKKVVSNFVKQRNGDRLGLIVFAEQAFLTIPLTLDTDSVVKMLNNLRVGMAGESTAIGDAIGIGVQNLRQRPLVSRVLILLTDGDDNASHIPPLEAAKIAVADKIKIYTVGVGNRLDERRLKKIASMTGGVYYKVSNVDTLQAVYKKIDELEKSETAQKALSIKTPLYHAFLFITLLCLTILFSINTKQYRYQHEFK